jgi:hypothetical protein
MGESSSGFLEARAFTKAFAKSAKQLPAAERELETLLKRASRRGGHAGRMASRVFNDLARLGNGMMALEARFGLPGPRLRPVGSFANLVRSERGLSLRLRGPAFFAFIDVEKFWWKVTWVLGISDIANEFAEFFNRHYADLIKDIWAALRAKNWKLARSLFRKMLGILKSPQFEEWLIKKIGKKAAKGVLKRLALRILPGIGWMVTVGMIIAAIIGQFIID